MSGARRVFVTGIAGLAGLHLARLCLGRGWEMAGGDSLSPYYSPSQKRARMSELARNGSADVTVEDLAQHGTAARRFAAFAPDIVFHLAAQPGARVSDVAALERENIRALDEVLSAVNASPDVSRFLFASSSSAYSGTKSRPLWKDATLSLAGLCATSRATSESRAVSSAQSGGAPTIVLRLFSVYGPWGQSDMAVLVAHSAFRKIKWKDVESLMRTGVVLDLAGALGNQRLQRNSRSTGHSGRPQSPSCVPTDGFSGHPGLEPSPRRC